MCYLYIAFFCFFSGIRLCGYINTCLTTKMSVNNGDRSSIADTRFSGLQMKVFDSGTLTRLHGGKKFVLKVAIQVPGGSQQLYEINRKENLQNIIIDFCNRWNVPNAETYALQNSDSNAYITETNRNEIKDGSLLKLAIRPELRVERTIKEMSNTNGGGQKLEAMKEIMQLSSDITCAEEIIRRNGIAILVGGVKNESYQGKELEYAFSSILELMDHGLVNLEDALTPDFIKQVSLFTSKDSETDAKTLQRAIGILELAVVHSQSLYQEIADVVTIPHLMTHLQKPNPEIQQNTIALINSLFMRAPHSNDSTVVGRRKISDSLAQKQFRRVILNNIIRTPSAIGAEMAHQLYVLQVLTLNFMEERMLTPLTKEMQEDVDKLIELRNLAFENQVLTLPKKSHTPGGFSPNDYKKLGFENPHNPISDMASTPPGVLSLDFMIYFARNQQDSYVRFILENSSRDDKHECPFAKSSIQITDMLCKILKIGEQPTETGQEFYPMFFAHDHALEEFYCICVQLFNKTWKEMGAIKDDFDKVLSVVQQQIILSLNQKPSSLDNFKSLLQHLSYKEILKKRQQERVDKEQDESKAKPVVELQAMIQPEIIQLIKNHRFNRLMEGAVFDKISTRRRDKSKWFCRLSPNKKYLHYGDIDVVTEVPSIESLPKVLPIAEIKDIIAGKNCPNIKSALKHKSQIDLSFRVSYDPEETLNFVALDKDTCWVWLDGINGLLGRDMISPKAMSDFELLIRMELKLRLLELEGVPIYDQPPPIPEVPANYDFSN